MTRKEAVMIELTPQEQQAVDTGSEPRLVDPRTRKTYVLVDAEVLGRLRGQSADGNGIDMGQVAVLVERAMSDDDAGDPSLEFYQQKYGTKS
jgi:hypothetical protein